MQFLDAYLSGDLSPTLASESEEGIDDTTTAVVRVVATSFPEM